MDEKYLEEIRNQEKILNELNSVNESQDSVEVESVAPTEIIEQPPIPEPAVKPPTGQSTLFGGDQ